MIWEHRGKAVVGLGKEKLRIIILIGTDVAQ